MSKIAYVRPYIPPTSYKRAVIHVSISTGFSPWFDRDIHDVTVCGTTIPSTGWVEVGPVELASSTRCKRCDRKRIEGVPAFDYEEELAGRASIHDPL